MNKDNNTLGISAYYHDSAAALLVDGEVVAAAPEEVNSGEYKLMGLAPYGHLKYADLMLGKLIDLKDDGTLRLDSQYSSYCTGSRVCPDSASAHTYSGWSTGGDL